MPGKVIDDWVLRERAIRMRASGYWSIDELAAELGISRRTLFRLLPAYLKTHEIVITSPEARKRQGAALRRWHAQLHALRLPRNGSVSVRDGQVVKTGRVCRFWRVFPHRRRNERR